MEDKVMDELSRTDDVMNYNLCARSRMTGKPVYKESELSKEYKDVMHGLKLAYSRVQNDLIMYEDILTGRENHSIRETLEAEVSYETLCDTLESISCEMIELLYLALDQQEGN